MGTNQLFMLDVEPETIEDLLAAAKEEHASLVKRGNEIWNEQMRLGSEVAELKVVTVPRIQRKIRNLENILKTKKLMGWKNLALSIKLKNAIIKKLTRAKNGKFTETERELFKRRIEEDVEKLRGMCTHPFVYSYNIFRGYGGEYGNEAIHYSPFVCAICGVQSFDDRKTHEDAGCTSKSHACITKENETRIIVPITNYNGTLGDVRFPGLIQAFEEIVRIVMAE